VTLLGFKKILLSTFKNVTIFLEVGTACSVEDETRNTELNGNKNPECWGDFSQLVKIEKTVQSPIRF